jgi:hypothetical protein
MEDPTFPHVIRVDSRYRLEGGTSTDFTVRLPSTVEFPEDCRCFVSAVSLHHSWWNVEQGLSDRLYVIETRTGEKLCRAVQVPAGNYTSLSLPAAIADALNSGKLWTNMSYVVDYVGTRGTLRIQLAAAGSVDASARFQLPSEDELLSSSWRSANWVGAINPDDLDTMSDLLRLSAVSAPTTLYETGLLDVSPVHVLHLRSNLAAFDTLGPRGEADIIQRVPVTTGYGYVEHYVANGSNSEFFSVGRGQFSELRFRLENVKGKTIDLHGGQVNIELHFDRPS